MIFIGVLLCVLPIYVAYSPAIIPKSPPLYDTVSKEEFLLQPQIDNERIDKAKDVLKAILGYKTDKEQNWLVLTQDYLEARPSGGFPGTYTHIVTSNGDVTSIKLDDIWNFDKPLEAQNKPQLNQSSWWAHFPHAAKYAIQVYEKHTGQKIDGVMTIDPTGIRYILKSLGPVHVPDFNETVNEKNVIDKILSYSPYVKDGRREAKHKLFIASIVKAINQKLSGFDVLSKRNEISKDFLRALERKHILIYAKNVELQKVLEENKWAGSIASEDAKDFLAVRDYNAGTNKVDLYIGRDIDYRIDIVSGGKPKARLEIKYSYKRDPILYKKYGDMAEQKFVQYKDILKIYTPKGSKLIDYSGYDGYVEEEAEDGKTVFKGLITLNPETEKRLVLRYRLPFEIENEYRLFVSKQPGVPVFDKKSPKLDVSIGMDKGIEAYFPNYNSFKNNLIRFETDLEYDRYIKLRF